VRAGSACRVHGVQGQVHRRGSAVHSKAPQSALRRTHRHPTAAARPAAAEPAPGVPAPLGEPPECSSGCG